jgi:3'(2'), 5'-bisphosphate nucleotidase
VLVGDDSAVLLRRQWTAEGVVEAVLLAAAGIGPDTPAVLATAATWGCDRVRDRPGGRGVVVVPVPGDDAPLVDRFLHLAALAATRVETAVALARGTGEERVKLDGSPSVAADEAAHVAASGTLGALGVPVLSEERTDRRVRDDEPWVVLDPLDGTGNFRAGLPPWAFSAGLVQAGRPVAGLVVDLSSGRRWWADGRAAWHDLDRSGTHAHDVAGALAVLLAAGGVALTPDGEPLVLRPDTERRIRLVAAPSEAAARELLAALR